MVEFIKSYPVILEKTKEGYSTYIPNLEGCVSFGKDIDEAVKNTKEALTLHVSGMIEDKEQVPSFNADLVQKEAKGNFVAFVEPDQLLLSKLVKGKSKRINITIDEHLLALSDKRAKELHVSRSALIESGLRGVVGA